MKYDYEIEAEKEMLAFKRNCKILFIGGLVIGLVIAILTITK